MAAELPPRHPDMTDEEYRELLIWQYNQLTEYHANI
jgi:hypothetical protein